jgi:hypothetical protein
VAEKLDPKETVSFEELLLSNVLQQEAMVNLLVRKGIFAKGEILEEIKRLKTELEKKAPPKAGGNGDC